MRFFQNLRLKKTIGILTIENNQRNHFFQLPLFEQQIHFQSEK